MIGLVSAGLDIKVRWTLMLNDWFFEAALNNRLDGLYSFIVGLVSAVSGIILSMRMIVLCLVHGVRYG